MIRTRARQRPNGNFGKKKKLSRKRSTKSIESTINHVYCVKTTWPPTGCQTRTNAVNFSK